MDLTMPFADKGDRVDFPAAKQGDNSMSLEQGFTSAYGLPPEEGGLFIDRQKFNQLMYLVSKGVIDNKTALESLTEKVNAIPGQIQSSISTLSGKYEEILPEKLTKFYIGPGKDDKFKDIDEAFYYIQRYSLNSGGNYIQLILRENFKFTKNYDQFVGLDLQNVIVSQENNDPNFFYSIAMDGENQIYDYDKPGFFYFTSCNCPDFRINTRAAYSNLVNNIIPKYNTNYNYNSSIRLAKYVAEIDDVASNSESFLVAHIISRNSVIYFYNYNCDIEAEIARSNLSSTAFFTDSSAHLFIEKSSLKDYANCLDFNSCYAAAFYVDIINPKKYGIQFSNSYVSLYQIKLTQQEGKFFYCDYGAVACINGITLSGAADNTNYSPGVWTANGCITGYNLTSVS